MKSIMKMFGSNLTVLLLVAAFAPAMGLAHPISMSSAVVDVDAEKAVVELRIMVEDLVLYHGLKPGDDNKFAAEDLKAAAEKHKVFLEKYFILRDTEGVGLDGEFTKVDLAQIPDEGVHPADLMAYAILYYLEYRFEKPPEYLQIAQNFGGDDATLPAVMDLAVLQQGVLFEEPTKISPQFPHIVRFDWEAGPQALPRSWRERKALRENKRDELLGITSYSSVYSYIYIQDDEVRHEILIPLLTLETWFKVERADPEFVSVDEQEEAEDKVEAFFQDRASVLIDGIQVSPVLDRLDFYGLDFKDFARAAPKKRVSIHTARVGMILSYPAKSPPMEVRITWDLFNDSVPFLRSTVFVHDEDAEQFFFVKDAPTFEWKREGAPALPQLAELPPPPKEKGGFFSKPDPISEQEAGAIFAILHKNIYRAFDYRRESAIYDALAQSVSGDLLTQLYIQILKGLKMQEQGGAVARVKEVEILDGRIVSPPDSGAITNRRFTYDCQWTVEGTVEHWGHIHSRVNQYRAEFQVVAAEGAWKIQDFQIRSAERLKFETGLRRFK